MQLIDSHCHIQSIGAHAGEPATRKLWSKASDLTPDNVIDRARQAHVTKLICVGCDLEDSKLAIAYTKNRPQTWASIGLHPHEAKHYVNDADKQAEFKELVNQAKVIAVGECGLDYFYNNSPKDDQIKILEMQLDLARSHNLPVIFHVRQALADFWPILDNFSGIRGVLHSFTDNKTNLAEGLKRGLYFGVNGIATFTKDDDQLEVYKLMPLDNLLLETDSPFLTPAPYRGNVNEPSRVETIANFIANLRGDNLNDLAAATTSNAHRLFGI